MKLKYTGAEPKVFKGVGPVDVGATVEVDETKAIALLASNQFEEATAKKAGKVKD